MNGGGPSVTVTNMVNAYNDRYNSFSPLHDYMTRMSMVSEFALYCLKFTYMTEAHVIINLCCILL